MVEAGQDHNSGVNIMDGVLDKKGLDKTQII
jgi:hypothetical protein